MDNNYSLSFINQEDFENHVKGTLETYDRSLNSINLASFNSNVIDPIKLLFDKEVFLCNNPSEVPPYSSK